MSRTFPLQEATLAAFFCLTTFACGDDDGAGDSSGNDSGATTGDPTTGGDPTTSDPTTDDPTTGDPTTSDPTTDGDTEGDPTTDGDTEGEDDTDTAGDTDGAACEGLENDECENTDDCIWVGSPGAGFCAGEGGGGIELCDTLGMQQCNVAAGCEWDEDEGACTAVGCDGLGQGACMLAPDCTWDAAGMMCIDT